MNGAPAGFVTAVQAAVQFFDSLFSNNISINIAFGWGEVGGDAIDSGAIGESSAEFDTTYTYAQVKSALATADAGSASILQAVQSLPITDPTGGASFVITTAEEKALRLYTGPASAIDGYVGLDSSSTFTFDPTARAVSGAYDAIGVLEHEISEVLGRSVFTSQQIPISRSQTITAESPLDLFRYSAPGVHTFQEGSAFFSLDGRQALKYFNDGTNGGDGGDWASSSQIDSFDAFGRAGVLQPVSAVDLEVMQVLGYASTPSVTTITGTSANHFTATFQGVYRQYTEGNGNTTVTGGPEAANDVLVNVQRLQFVDGYLAVSPTDKAGQIYRLYEATLGRAPDEDGLVYWVDALNSGASLQSAAAGFVNSQEFQSTYGSLDNSHFVTLLYNNVLHRAPDAGGLSYWTNLLNTGQDSRAQAVIGFSESSEDIADLAAPVQQGLWIGNADAAEVARLYDAALARLPDLSGLTSWTNQLESGASLESVASGFISSAEFQSTYGSLDNSHFVTQIYENVLHRAPDAGGLSYWVNALGGGASRAQVVVGFSESQEHIVNTAAHIDDGIWITS